MPSALFFPRGEGKHGFVSQRTSSGGYDRWEWKSAQKAGATAAASMVKSGRLAKQEGASSEIAARYSQAV